jgi:hypothetical protein
MASQRIDATILPELAAELLGERAA